MRKLLKELGYTLIFILFYYYYFESESLFVVLVILELGYVDQASLKPTEICLPLLLECWD